MAKKLQSIRGIHDGLPEQVRCWQHIEQAARTIFERYAFSEVRLPVLEPTELFVRSIGAATDIVSKEMYAFVDQGGDHICLRPEGTAGAVRAYLQAGLTRSGAQRWYYMGPMFRRERPQKGRLRQFQQIGLEWFGVSGPVEDVEVLALAESFLKALGLVDLRLELNSLGCDQCRPVYRTVLVDFLRNAADRLCETCHERTEKNPMRVLDCKEERCQSTLREAPEITGHLCAACASHFEQLKLGLDALGIGYEVNPRIVRGLDYYNRTAFEFVTDRLGAQGTVLAGGRYDGLIEELGGPATPAIGFAAGVERLAMLLETPESPRPDFAIVSLGEQTLVWSLEQADWLRSQGFVVVHCGGGGAKRQFKLADREHARFTAVIGEEEMQRNLITVKDMETGEQRTMTRQEVVTFAHR
ncbi:MAG: histidine--tRNA ligase [Zetaproteobacteria bacterium]|nr:MAG: histidine--tRNA ligase [Zetaproteobacteria bacterium]